MKRVAIFLILGPAIALAAVHLWQWTTYSGPFTYPLFSPLLGTLVFFAYMAGFVPALTAAVIDMQLASKIGGWRRVLVTSIAGGAATAACALLQISSPDRGIIYFGVAGAIAAAICSLLSGVKMEGGKDA
jgi:hypothetical protein